MAEQIKLLNADDYMDDADVNMDGGESAGLVRMPMSERRPVLTVVLPKPHADAGGFSVGRPFIFFLGTWHIFFGLVT